MLLKCNPHLAMLCLLPVVGCYKLTAGEAFYIIPSLSSSCPQQHCFTLEQLLSNARRYLSSNITLYFLPGTHSLQSEHVIRDISELHLLSVSDFPLEEARISCGSTASILIENVHLVHMSHLHFIGCRKNKIESINQLIVNNLTFHGLQGRDGTALELIHTNAKINNSSFLFNRYGTYRGPLGLLEFLIQRKQIPPQSLYALVGAALIVNGSNVNVTVSRFEGNIAQLGGAIYSEGKSNITLSNCTLINNHALSSGILKGAGGVLLAFELTHMTITESIFYSNSAQLHGGVIFMALSCNLIILQCQFNNNKASEGGVVSAKFQSNVTVLDSNFNNNTAYESGGVVRIFDGATIHITNSSFKECTAKWGGILTHKKNTLAIVSNCRFYRNFATEEGGVFYSLFSSHIALIDCDFIDNRAVAGGVGTTKYQCSATIEDSSGFNNVASHQGGVVYATVECLVYIKRCQFSGCKARVSSLEKNDGSGGGVVRIGGLSKLIIKDCEIYNNTAAQFGGVVLISNHSSMYINNTQFNFNHARVGGVIDLDHKANVTIINCNFTKNLGTNGSGAISLVSGTLIITHSIFEQNDGDFGGAISTDLDATAIIEDSIFIGNRGFAGGTLFCYNTPWITLVNTLISESVASSGSVYVIGGIVNFKGNVTITRNIGTVQVLRGAKLYLLGYTTFENNIMSNFTIKADTKLNEGGALTVDRSLVTIIGLTYFYNNTAEKGAAIHAISSNVRIHSTVIIANNTARYNGGGLYLYQSVMTCIYTGFLKIVSNCALNSGGGIYAVSSSIDIVSLHHKRSFLVLIDNSAKVGGGLCMKANAKLYMLKVAYQLNETTSSYSAVFYHNLADYGGAIAVEDGTNLDVCDSNPHLIQDSSLNQEHAHYTDSECFLQLDALHGHTDFNFHYASYSINFTYNYARYAGSTLFGGLLDRCIAISFIDEFFDIQIETILYNGISYLKHISNIVEDKVSSQPVKVCFCNDSQPDCSYELQMKQLRKGENFTIALVAVDQVNHTISNTTIHAYLKFDESGFGEGQLVQKTEDSCTDLTYSITSVQDHERIVIYAEGPCRDSSISKRWIDIEFIPCTCPVGFQQKNTENTNCVCICDSALLPYVSSCNAQEETVTKHNNAWISYVNQTLNLSGYLIHDHCPFDYCLSPNSDHEVKVNLNEKNGADAQCAHNHTGILCGACKPGFSLSLGSSHCIPCSHWHANLPIILFTAIVSGVILITMLLVLNLTVAVGTLNGIIFYANIVASNFSTLFPFSSPNFVTVFISWLNLDVGIDTCFIDEMDAYWKLWIDTLFPAYLIILVVVIIFISERSTRFAQLIGKRNPVATMATLILLSYAKLLRSIILSFSFAVLKYPDNSVQLLWLSDGTVKYLSGKHIALFIMALIIVVVGVAYTLLLFLWQWILQYQHKFLLRLANNQGLNHLLDPYHAPYVYAYRYWTGLLLLVRAALYIIAAVNVSNDPGINLLAIGFAVISILLLKGCLKRNKIYKKWPLELIEMISYINLAFFCQMSFYLLDDKAKQRIAAYISGSITLALFIIILIYHIIFELIFKLLKRSRNRPVYLRHVTQIDIEENSNDQTALVAPTSSTVDPPTPGELPLSVLVETEGKSE